MTMLSDQLQVIEDDIQHLLKLLESPKMPAEDRQALAGRYQIALSHLLGRVNSLRMEAVKAGSGAAAQGGVATQGDPNAGGGDDGWGALAELRLQASQVMDEALAYAGGAAISRSELFQPVTTAAGQYLAWLAGKSGGNWKPALAAGGSSERSLPESLAVQRGPQDSLARLPLLHYDLWRLPLLAERWGTVTIKSGDIPAVTEWVAGQASRVGTILSDAPPAGDALATFLPEVRLLASARLLAADAAAFAAGHQGQVQPLAQRQLLHFWRLGGVTLAAYLAGPAYAMALVFLELDPTQQGQEGERTHHSRYQPSDLKRAALVFQALQAVDSLEKTAHKSEGPYRDVITLLDEAWRQALEGQNSLGLYLQAQEEVQAWGAALLGLFDSHFSIARHDTAQRWREAVEYGYPLLEEGASAAAKMEVPQALAAAWWCRLLHPQRAGLILKETERLLSNNQPVNGLLEAPPVNTQALERLVHSRMHDLESGLKTAEKVFRSPLFQQGDRQLVSGRFYRLLSDQDFALRRLRRAMGLGNPAASTLTALGGLQGGINDLQQELLEFLGGVLIRLAELDEGACRLADGLLSDFSRRSGVGWGGRSIPGQNPLFSQATGLVHLRFPDWDIWNLPLMAHEFGHVTALATPEFEQWLVREQGALITGHPQAAGWTDEQKQEYLEQRRLHLHEFFADAYALYVQGPAYLCAVLLLNFNPGEARQARGSHPSHAERAELLFKVLEEMNQQEKRNNHTSGPYADVLASLRSAWDGAAGAEVDPLWTFHKLKAVDLGRKLFALLDRYFRWGAVYPAEAWERAEKYAPTLPDDPPDFKDESLRSLLGIAWEARRQHPSLHRQIAGLVRSAMLEKLSELTQ